jgi:hypothetical protein
MLGRLRSHPPAERLDEFFFLLLCVGCQRVERGDVAQRADGKKQDRRRRGRKESTRIADAIRFLSARIGELEVCAFGRHPDECESMQRESARCSCRHPGQRRAASRRDCQGATLGGCGALRAQRYFHSPGQRHRRHRGLKPRAQSKSEEMVISDVCPCLVVY